MRLFFSSMQAIGVDIFCLNRIDLDKTNLFLRVLTEKEYLIFQSLKNDQAKKEYFGSRFAAKEAYIKAGHANVSYSSIEIMNDQNGKPYFTNDNKALLSISHEKEYAIAFVVSL